MLDVVLTFIFAVVIVSLDVFWLRILFLFLLIILLLPGMYAMISGAPFVATRKNAIQAMIRLGNFSEKDKVVELGCGDGRVIRAISDCGVGEAVGYEFSVPTYLWAELVNFFSKKRTDIRFGNFWKENLSGKDVFVCFLMKDAMHKFEKEVWPGLKPGARLISNAFKLKNVKPVKVDMEVYLYVR